MKILLVYPKTPPTFYSFDHALKLIAKKSDGPPLGLITVAAMLPESWGKKLVDLNVSRLVDSDILWADYVFISGMSVHDKSFRQVVRRCNQLGAKVVAGGPLVTMEYMDFPGVDHFVLNEAEITLPIFLKDLENGNPSHFYTSADFPDLSSTPVPQWDLLRMKDYATMNIQYSRGCPHDCEFCSITFLNGRKPRTKSREQFINELESLYKAGWRRRVFIVDDNFIGNRRKLKEEILPAMIEWSSERNYPFVFTTEVTVDITDDPELMDLMVSAGFETVFIGIETPNDDSLAECGKYKNRRRDLVAAIKNIQRRGLMVSAGFIVGFDSDPPGIFQQQIKFIQNSGIVTAMVGILNAPVGTRLFKRLKSEKRLLNRSSGDNMDCSTNFIPKMDYQKLVKGYKDILETIYSQNGYYERIKLFLKEYRPPKERKEKVSIVDLPTLARLTWALGIRERGKRYFWKLFFLSLFRYPQRFPLAMTLAVYGFHFRQIVIKV